MKNEMLNCLENYWTSGRDNDLIKDFITHFFDSYQPERSKREDSTEFVIKGPKEIRNSLIFSKGPIKFEC